jgi:hypothetical protein
MVPLLQQAETSVPYWYCYYYDNLEYEQLGEGGHNFCAHYLGEIMLLELFYYMVKTVWTQFWTKWNQ